MSVSGTSSASALPVPPLRRAAADARRMAASIWASAVDWACRTARVAAAPTSRTSAQPRAAVSVRDDRAVSRLAVASSRRRPARVA